MFIDSLRQTDAQVRTCAFALVIGHSPTSRAAAVTWTNLTLKAMPWAARFGHTTVIDAAGAIYVIGGLGSSNVGVYQDVWVSTDGGA